MCVRACMCACVCVIGRETKRDSKRELEKETHTHKHTHTTYREMTGNSPPHSWYSVCMSSVDPAKISLVLASSADDFQSCST